VLRRDDNDTARVEALLQHFHKEYYEKIDAAHVKKPSPGTGH
jgi:hypothetical protein